MYSKKDYQLLTQIQKRLQTESIANLNNLILSLPNETLDQLHLTTIAQYQHELLMWQSEILNAKGYGFESEEDLNDEMEIFTRAIQDPLINFNTKDSGKVIVEYIYDDDDIHFESLSDLFGDVFDIKTPNLPAIQKRIQKIIESSDTNA